MEIPIEITSNQRIPMVSLTTDFGNKDYYTASLKANLYNSEFPFRLIDVSHEIDTHDIIKAAFFLENFYLDFPKGSIHVVAVNNAYEFEPELICFLHHGHYFIGPNNGLFSLAFKDLDEKGIRLVTESITISPKLNDKISKTVHHILAYNHINNLGKPLSFFDQKLGIKAVFTHNEIRASVVHIDHYSNVIINLKKKEFENYRKGREFNIFIKPTEPIEYVSESYSEVPVGEALCIFNDTGYLTIAINMGKASSMYSLNINDMIQILFY